MRKSVFYLAPARRRSDAARRAQASALALDLGNVLGMVSKCQMATCAQNWARVAAPPAARRTASLIPCGVPVP